MKAWHEGDTPGMDESLTRELKEAEAAIADTERRLGPDSPELADLLQKYAALLRKTERRALDAVNVEARAKAIRAKMYAEEERVHGTTTVTVVKPKERERAALGMYLGLAGVAVAVASLFINHAFLKILLPLAVVLAIADVVITRGGLWRIVMVIVFAGSAWCADQSLPDLMLVNSPPIDRFNYASEHPDIVSEAHKLDKPSQVFGYQISLPAEYKQSADNSYDWGRAIIWQSPPHPDQQPSQLSLLLVKLPEDLLKRRGNYSVLKAARDVALPRVCEAFNLSDCAPEMPQIVELNGMEFARIDFKAKSPYADVEGLAYVSTNPRNLVVLAAYDEVAFATETLATDNASVYTFVRQQRSAGEI
jgi:hypothetical protein